MTGQCRYVSPENDHCKEPDLGNGYCFWHDGQADKSGLRLADKLETYTRNGGLTKGLKLKQADLRDIDLENRGKSQGFDFSYSDFYGAKLHGGQLFNLVMRRGSLMKANLERANLHCADLEMTNLLGAKFHDTNLDNLHIGARLIQQVQAEKHAAQHDTEAARNSHAQAEEVYRNLHTAAEQQGLYRLADRFGYREIVMRRNLMPRWSLKWLFSHLIDWLCGYGEKPENTIIFSLLLILVCAFGYALFGMHYDDQVIRFSQSVSMAENINTFLMAIYYSVVTFTTLGYGDITPFGVTRSIAVVEAFLGSFTIALFVVVFVKRMSR